MKPNVKMASLNRIVGIFFKLFTGIVRFLSAVYVCDEVATTTTISLFKSLISLGLI